MYSLRAASQADFKFLQVTHEKTLRPYVEQIWGWNDSQQESLLRDRFDPTQLQIIQIKGKDIGLLQVERRPGAVFLGNLLILPGYQRCGLGTLIVQDIIKDAGDLPVELSVLKPNPAKRLYERLGFLITSQDDVRYQMKRNPRI